MKRLAWARATAAVAIMATAAACDSPEERIAEHYANGVALLESGDPDRAALEFRNVLRLNENHAPSRLELARLHERNREFSAAIANYRLVAELDAQNFDARLRLAQLLLLAGELGEANGYADAAVALQPESADALTAKAAVLQREGDAGQARDFASRAIAADPGHVAASLLLVGQRATSGDQSGAIAELDALIEATPKEQAFHLLKLRLLNEIGDRDGVMAHLDRAVQEFPEERLYRQARAQGRRAAGDLDGAEADLRALATAPEEVDPALALAAFLLAERGEDAARAELEARLVSAEPAPFRLLAALVELEWRAGLRDQARARLAPVAEGEGPDVGAARVALARLALDERDFAEARRLSDLVLAGDESDVEALKVRAAIAIEEDRAADALTDLRRAASAAPQDVQVMLLTSRALEREGSMDLAIERLASATQVSGHQPEIATRYATFLRGRGQREGAEAVLAETARRHPQDLRTLTMLAQVRIELEDWSGAAEATAAISRLEGGGVVARQVEAASLNAQGRLEESLGVLEDVALAEGGDAALAGLVTTLVRLGEVDRAVEVADEALAADPTAPRALLLRAELHLMRGEAAEAEGRVRDIIAAHAEAPIGYLALGRLKLREGDLESAERVAREGISAIGDSVSLRLMAASMAEQRRDFGAAISDYEAVYALNPDSLVAANNLASLIAEHQYEDPARLEHAARLAQRLRTSEVPAFQDTFGWIQFLRGDVEGSLRSLLAAAEGMPDNAIVRYHAGRALAAAGRDADARGHLEAALALDPDFVKAESALEALAAMPAAQ